MNRWCWLVVFVFVGMSTLRATTDAQNPVATPPQTDPAVVLAHYHEVLARPEYIETQEPDANTRLKEWLSLWFLRLGAQFGQFKYASRMPAFESMLMTVLAALSIAALLYTMFRLTRRHDRTDLPAVKGDLGPKTFRPPESYDQEIQQAVLARNWHGAWLATWRQFLSRLENRHLVEADRTRTNREYLAQLRAKALPAPALGMVKGMVDDYDQYIYGRHPISEPDWTLFHRQIDEAALLLHLDESSAALRKSLGKS